MSRRLMSYVLGASDHTLLCFELMKSLKGTSILGVRTSPSHQRDRVESICLMVGQLSRLISTFLIFSGRSNKEMGSFELCLLFPSIVSFVLILLELDLLKRLRIWALEENGNGPRLMAGKCNFYKAKF